MSLLSRLPVIGSKFDKSHSGSKTAGYSTSSFSLPQDIGFEELKKKLDGNEITLIDVRAPSEHSKIGKIPNSKNIILEQVGTRILMPDDEFAEKCGFKKPHFDDPLAVNCFTGVRARTAQLAIMAVGYKNVRLYKGSFKDWKEQGGPVEYPPEPESVES
ncbi:Thiosulfate sulfurtransferase/rhodanese-like domain-containing protein 3 [Halocaridina rubra]|uniref:Thiosulfate sulfurtransferase/rhodanese-like domain-containing protein 3 n=1 Tax=Halocaridina rubra TaxID=373956 RepID=A0AAN8XV42_HALRR